MSSNSQLNMTNLFNNNKTKFVLLLVNKFVIFSYELLTMGKLHRISHTSISTGNASLPFRSVTFIIILRLVN